MLTLHPFSCRFFLRVCLLRLGWSAPSQPCGIALARPEVHAKALLAGHL
jgi:hypothetical protein